MEYLDPQFRIARFLSKPVKSGQLMLAHLKFLKEGSNDYSTLLNVGLQRQRGENVSEFVPWTDGEFDIQKVKTYFAEKGVITETEFDEAHEILKKSNHIRSDKFEAKEKSVIDVEAITSVQPVPEEIQAIINKEK